MKQNMMLHIVFLTLTLFQIVMCSETLRDDVLKKLDALEAEARKTRRRADSLWMRLNFSERINSPKEEQVAWQVEVEALAAEINLKLAEQKLGLSELSQDK